MTDSRDNQDNKSTGAKNDLSLPHPSNVPSTEPFSAEMESEVITEKFLAVAKEKSSLESVILQQNDIIKGLEKEKEKLTLSLRKFMASHKSMKEKLLDFDLLRNMEISELKKQIEGLIADNKKLISDKDSIIISLERDHRNISRADNREIGVPASGERELAGQPAATPGRTEDEQNTRTDSDTVRDLECELSLVRSQMAEIELDRDEARAELYNSRVEIDHLKADRAHVEENLRQKVDDYSTEIAGLKTDIDELTSAIENRISEIDELNARVTNLSSALNHKDSELHERVPALLDKINSLSQSIDMKMEENSLFAKELFDLNCKISSLNDEMLAKDEFLIEISEDYKKQKDEIEALHGAHELTLRNLVYERDLLKKEGEDLRNIAAIPQQQLEHEQRENKVLQARVSEILATIDERSRENAGLIAQISEKDAGINDLQRDILLMESRVEEATTEHASKLDALREKITALNQQLLKKQELLTVMASELENEKNESLYQLDSLRKEKAALEEDLVRAEEKINKLVLEQERLTYLSIRQEQALSDAMAQINVLQTDAAALQASQAGLQKQLTDKQEAPDLGGAERAELQKIASAYQETFEHLKQEIVSLNKKLAEKEQAIDLLLTEKNGLAGNASDQQKKLEQSLISVRDLERQLQESRQKSSRLIAENSDYVTTITRLQDEISSLNRTGEEEVRVLKDDLSSYGRAVADLRLKFEQVLNINTELREQILASESAGRKVPLPATELREETLPARVARRSSARRRPLAYALVAFLLLGAIGYSLYAFSTGLITLPIQRPADRETQQIELDYADMFSMLTKASASDDLKFQATLLTESLVLKSDIPGEKSLFDFQNHLYFKISISAPRAGLDPKIAADPYSAITLTAGADTVTPLSDVHVRDLKTFYRKEEPVSITFYCAFPKTALTSGRSSISLSVTTEKDKAEITWDPNSLRAGNLAP